MTNLKNHLNNNMKRKKTPSDGEEKQRKNTTGFQNYSGENVKSRG